MPTERAQYNPPSAEQLLSKLAWLNGRSQPDFKGHVSKAEPRLTASLVQERKEAEMRKRCGADNFLPFQNAGNKYVNMRFAATRPSVKRRDEHPVGNDQTHATIAANPTKNMYRQELDPHSGRPLIASVLSYNEQQFIPQQRMTGRRTFTDKNGSGNIFTRSSSDLGAGEGSFPRPTFEDIRVANADERLNVLRADMMRHPLYTNESRIAHATTHWDPMTQLLAHQYGAPPPRKERPQLQSKRNPVRMVEVMRRSQSVRPWH